MGTTAKIGFQTNKTVVYVNLSYDGYKEYTGQILLDHFNTRPEVEALVDLGDLSSISTSIEEVEAYHRDKGEEFQQYFTALTDYCSGVGYRYLFAEDNKWYYVTPYGIEPLVISYDSV